MVNKKQKHTTNSHHKILFIHHSTGGNLIKEGLLREDINKLNPHIEFWDHSYNLFPIFTKAIAKNTHLKGLSNAKGEITGQDYNIVLSNNSPKEYAEIFSRNPDDPTLKAILSYDLIAFKNCYPTTRITSSEQLSDDIKYYTEIREELKQYTNNKFVLLTPPPAREKTTTIENATRAIKLVNWLTSDEFTKDTTNICVFDFFGLLANDKGMLKKEYERELPWDSHPNVEANKTIAPIFADFIVKLL